ncbi:glycosyl transferase [Histidinibacterium aquaticum]|uniref:Glycosyl transferase n=1 Tax=Histidinibacterium aquaticum TaxID=2613962 RepID=A0A5J5GKR9_9RHOB|nr:glycosyl transferase [Histidinibacterium aquaticum]KAA9008228.1 glycosyl transferase [Histidinibacterium aquaticum]
MTDRSDPGLEGVRPEGPARSTRAFVTLVTKDDFAVGARALLRSLRLAGTDADFVVMHTGRLSHDSLDMLRAQGARLVETDLLPTSAEFDAAHARDALHGRAPFTKGTKPDFHTPLDNFAKLRLWQLDYERAVFLDADTIALRPLDVLFDYPELCAAPNVYESLADFHRMNSGVFTARPSSETFDRLMEKLDRPGAFWRRTDQTFLQDAFPGWHGLPVYYNMLQLVWVNLPGLWHWPSVKLVHYQYAKPWTRDAEKMPELAPLVELWEAYAGDGPVPDLDTLPAPPGA